MDASLEERQHAKQIIMTTDPVDKLICKMAVPTIIGMLISAIYNIADTYFVGKLNNISATGAVGVVFAFMTIIQAIGFFFGHGSGNYISRKLGNGETEQAQTMASTGFCLSFVIGVIIAVFGLIFRGSLVHLLQATDTIYPYAVDYITYILLGTPFMISSIVINNQLRFQGSAFYGMIGMTAGGILNIMLDPVFIFVFKMGVSGAALATMISQMIGFIMLCIMAEKSDGVKIRFSKLSLKLMWFKEIIRGGMPSLCRQCVTSVSAMCLNAGAGYIGFMLGTGDAPITAMTVVTKVMQFANSVLIGFGQGFQPVCGFNYGAGEYKRVKDGFWFCIKFSFGILVIFSVIGCSFAETWIKLFQNDADVISFGATALKFQCYTFSLSGWIVICNMMQQTMGKAVRASILALLRQGITFIPFVIVLPKLFGAVGLQIAQPIADMLTFVISIPLQISIMKELDTKE